MADFNFTVDTSPMASEIQSVSHGVNRVSGAVVAMPLLSRVYSLV